MFLKMSQNSQENICARAANRCFPVNFVEFLRTPFLTEHLVVASESRFSTALILFMPRFTNQFRTSHPELVGKVVLHTHTHIPFFIEYLRWLLLTGEIICSLAYLWTRMFWLLVAFVGWIRIQHIKFLIQHQFNGDKPFDSEDEFHVNGQLGKSNFVLIIYVFYYFL